MCDVILPERNRNGATDRGVSTRETGVVLAVLLRRPIDGDKEEGRVRVKGKGKIRRRGERKRRLSKGGETLMLLVISYHPLFNVAPFIIQAVILLLHRRSKEEQEEGAGRWRLMSARKKQGFKMEYLTEQQKSLPSDCETAAAGGETDRQRGETSQLRSEVRVLQQFRAGNQTSDHPHRDDPLN